MKYTVKALFLQDSLRRWHFKDLIQTSGMSRERVNHYLKELLQEGIVLRIKPRGRVPYYQADTTSPQFRTQKQIYGLQLLQESGLFEHLRSLAGIKTAILFGSFARGDWGKSSDVDLFLYGKDEAFDQATHERKLQRAIQLFSYRDPAEIRKELDPKLIPNILQGIHIKPNLEPFERIIHA